MNHQRFLLPLIAAIITNACATLSENECATADWERLGEADGDLGRPADYIERHVEACAKHGIEPDRTAWERGHAGGLDDYCSVRGGLEAGRRGSSYQQVCTPGFEEDFMEGYRIGRRIHQVRSEIDELENAIRLYELDLSSAGFGDDPQNRIDQRRAAIDLTRYRQQLLARESELEQLERQASVLLRR